MDTVRFVIHYGLHFIFPGFIAYLFFRDQWKQAWILLIATMLIDLDHLLAHPIFDADRCSINFHPLHTYYALAVYILLFLIKKTRIIGLGLGLHFVTDWLDCLLM